MKNFFTLITISKNIIFNYSILFILAYFIFHSIYGNRGIIAYFKLNQQLEKSYSEIDALRAERIEIEHKVHLLKAGDKDMIDEEARRAFGMALPNEKVFKVNR